MVTEECVDRLSGIELQTCSGRNGTGSGKFPHFRERVQPITIKILSNASFYSWLLITVIVTAVAWFIWRNSRTEGK